MVGIVGYGYISDIYIVRMTGMLGSLLEIVACTDKESEAHL